MIIEITAVESTVTVHMELSEMRSIKVFFGNICYNKQECDRRERQPI